MRGGKTKSITSGVIPIIHHFLLPFDFLYLRDKFYSYRSNESDKFQPLTEADSTILPISRQDFHVKGFSRIAKLEHSTLIERVSKLEGGEWKKMKEVSKRWNLCRYYSIYLGFKTIFVKLNFIHLINELSTRVAKWVKFNN